MAAGPAIETMNGKASVDIRATARGSADPVVPERTRPGPLFALIAIAVAIASALFLIAGPIARHALPATELGEPFADQHQDAETLMFIVSFVVLLPLSLIASGRICDRIWRGPSYTGLSALAALLMLGLALVLLFVKLSLAFSSWGGGEGVMVAGGAIWLIAAAAAVWRADSPRPWGFLDRASEHSSYLWAAAGVAVLGVALSFSTLDSISPLVLAIGLVLIAVVLTARERIDLPALPRGVGAAIDVGVILLLVLAIPNLFVIPTGSSEVFNTSVTQFHQNFYLGPANQILAGDAMLVETLSQYGVVSIYFLAGMFQIFPIGYGTLGLIEGLLSTAMFVGAYGAIRIAGVPRLLAGSAIGVAVFTLVWSLDLPLGALLQHGAFRFGLPVGVILGAVVESRWPQARVPARALILLTIALASVWALEAFAYTMLTVIAIIALRTFMLPASERRRELIFWAAGIGAAFLLAHLVFALVTLAVSGELPDWGWYLNTLREFLTGQLGDLTYDFSRWSPGLALGPIYLASAAAVVMIARRRPETAAREQTLLIAIAGMTAFGIALLSYLVNRSADHIVPYVSLPAVMLGALWLALISRPGVDVPRAAYRGALGMALAIAVLLISVNWSSANTGFTQSALGYAKPGGASLTSAFDRLWDSPVVRPIAIDGEKLLETQMPGESRSIVVTSPDPGLEMLIRTGRGSAIPLGDPYEDSFVPEDHLEPLGEWVDTVEPGDRMLLDPRGREAWDLYRREPDRDPFTGSAFGVPNSEAGITTLQEWVLRELGKRFDIEVVGRSPNGLEVVEFVPRGSKG